MKNSKNSHITPMVMLTQKATSTANSGESENEIRSLRFIRSTSEKPMAAATKPFTVCSSVSHSGIRS